MDRRRINLSLSEEQYEMIVQQAAKNKIPPSAYCTALVMKEIINTDEYETIDKDTSVNKAVKTIRLSDEDAFTLSEKASQLGLSSVAYIRNLIHTKDFVVHDIVTDDITEYINEVHKVVASIQSLISMIRREGKGKVFESDVKELLKTSAEIKILMRKQLQSTYSNRQRAYETMTKK